MKKSLVVIIVLVVAVAGLTLTGCSKSDPAKGKGSGNGGGNVTKTDPGKLKDESVPDLLAKGGKVDELRYEFVQSNATGTTKGKVWLQGKKMKNEVTTGDRQVTTIIDLENKQIINYDSEQKIAYKLPAAAFIETVKTPADYLKKTPSNEAKAIENVVYDGVWCKVIEAKEEGGSKFKMWVRLEDGIPVKIETEDATIGKTVIEYRNIVVGLLPADTFKVPGGFQIIDQTKL